MIQIVFLHFKTYEVKNTKLVDVLKIGAFYIALINFYYLKYVNLQFTILLPCKEKRKEQRDNKSATYHDKYSMTTKVIC